MQSLLRGVFRQHATRLAVQGRAVVWTYAELDRLSAALARKLIESGLQPGDMVPILMGRSPLLLLSQVALLRAGAAYSPIDMASPEARQRTMLAALGSKLRLVAQADREGAEGSFDVAGWLGSMPQDGPPEEEAWLAPPPDSPVYVMFTSGSTGVPKGVMVPHAGIVRLVHEAGYADFGPEQRWGFISSPAFDLATLEVWGALLNGGCCVVQEEAMPSLDVLGEFLLGQRITDTWLTSALFNSMVEDQLPALGQLRQLLVGGERVSARHARMMLQAHPRVRLIDGYGPTENTTFTLCHTITLADTEGAAGVPIGTPLMRTQVRVEPLEAEEPERGELWTAGDGVALGYLGDPALTAEKFVQFEGRRWYRTGDLVRRRPDGVFEFHGRIDRQIKLRGQRIELEEVELALTRSPGVGNGAVLVVGEQAEQRRIVAIYSLLGPDGPGPESIAASMRQSLPEAAMPGEFVLLPQLPANLNGKVDRQALARLLAERSAPAHSAAATELPLTTRLQRIARTYPERLAVEAGAERIGYAELERRSTAVAARLVALGISAGDRVALFMPRSSALVVAMLACVRIGAVYSPIDLASPPARLARMLAVLKPGASIVCAGTHGLAPGPVIDLGAIDWHEVTGDLQELPPVPSATAATPACIFFTSGSTGVPKAVMVPAAGIERLVRDDTHAHFGLEQRWAFMSSPAFDAATLEVWGPLLNGGACVVQEIEDPSLADLARFLVERRITDAWLTSGLFSAMVQDELPSLGGLRQLLTGGERVMPSHAALMLAAHPGTRLVNGYGPTENTTFTLCRTVTAADTESPAGIPLGLPVPDTRIRIEPAEAGNPREGELWTAGAGVALGYFGDEAATAERFVSLDGQRWYKTGDWVRQRADGSCDFLGRQDHQVKLQGHRIETDEVEQALAACAGVGQAVVILRGHDPATRHLAACFTAATATEAAPRIEAVAEELASQLPATAMPKVFRLVASMPITLNGKIDRTALAGMLDAEETTLANSDGAEPSAGLTPAEALLAGIWQALLPHAKLSADANFLRVGGTSLLALHVAALVRKRLDKLISPVEVLRHPVLAEQALLVEKAAAAPARRDAVFADWNIPLSRAQQNVLAATRLDPTGCAYLVHVALHVPAAQPEAPWRAAFEKLAQRHPALRLQAQHDGFVAHARLQPALPDGWWQQHPAIDQAPADLDWPLPLLAEVNRSLETATQGSMRVDCWPVRSGGLLLVWTLHHYVIDEAGIEVALTELDALLQGRALPPVYGSPFAFATIETAWSDAAANEAWAEKLTATLHGHPAPLKHPPALGREVPVTWSAAQRSRLTERCEAWGCTPFPVVLTAYGLALQDLFGAAFRFVSTPFSRRAEPELIEPIGYLLDVRFIEAGALPGESVAQTLWRVMRDVHEAQKPAFQLIDDLIEAVSARDPGVAQSLTQFGLTWRIDPAADITLAGQSVRKIRVPQIGARYALCLHLAQLGEGLGASIEAPAEVHESGVVARLWAAFSLRLEALLSIEEPVPVKSEPQRREGVPGRASAHEPALRAAWARWLGVRESDIGPETHFLRSGGSSLVAMRMAAGLRRDHGLNVDVGAFLADPRFGRLASIAHVGGRLQPDGYVLLGPADFTRVMVVLPGAGGQAAGMFALGDELHRRLGARTAVAIVDLDAALELAPAEDPLWFVSQRIVQIVRDLGRERVMGMIGFSMGGTLALRVVEALGAGRSIPVWMLDTFAPRAQRGNLWRKVERNLAWRFFGGRPPLDGVAPLPNAQPSLQALPLRATPAQWARLGEQLDQQSAAAPSSEVRLIQARQSVQDAGLLWQRRNNGFDPQQFASWEVHEIDGAHLDIPRHLAASTVGIIVENGQFDAAGAG